MTHLTMHAERASTTAGTFAGTPRSILSLPAITAVPALSPPEQRLRSVIARERQASAVFAAAKQNLTNPPKIYTDIAIEQLPRCHFLLPRGCAQSISDRARRAATRGVSQRQ